MIDVTIVADQAADDVTRVAATPTGSHQRVVDLRPVSSRLGELLAVLAMLVAVASVGAFVVV
jgi:hypothetical protein